jgi:predicted Zn-dependent peptidase
VARPAPARTATIGTGLSDTYLMAAFVGPEIAEPTEVCATDVITVLLSNASYGRLKRRLQDQSNLVKTMGVDFLTQRDRALLGIWARCDAKDVPQVKQAIQAELTRLATEPIPAKELAIAKRLTLSGYAFANEAASDRATTLAFYESLNGYREAGLYAGRVRGLTEADIRKVAQWYAGTPTWVMLSQQQKGVT